MDENKNPLNVGNYSGIDPAKSVKESGNTKNESQKNK